MGVNKFLIHDKNFFTIQDLMDEVGHEIQKLNQLSERTYSIDREIELLRMFKSDLRNIVRRYKKLECLI